jgi:hypothetical protein
VGSNPFLANHHINALWDLLVTLQTEFGEIHLRVKEANAQKRHLVAQSHREAAMQIGSESQSEFESEDDSDSDNSSIAEVADLPKLRINFLYVLVLISRTELKVLARTSTLRVV